MAEIGVSSPVVTGGEGLSGRIRLREPAVEPREVRLRVRDETYRSEQGLADSEFVIEVPDRVMVPAGRQEVKFAIRTAEVPVVVQVGIEAHLDGSSAATLLEVAPRRGGLPGELGLELRFLDRRGSLSRYELDAGGQVEMEVSLGEPAPADLRIGIEVYPDSGSLNYPGTLVLPRGERTARFLVVALEVNLPADFVVEARVGDARTEAHLNLVPRR